MSLSNGQIKAAAITIWLFTIVVFANTFDHEYAWDDRIVITENPYVLKGVDGLEKIWIKQHSDYLHDKIGYRPVTLTTFALEQQVSPLNPKLGHIVNVLLYSFLVLSILYFLRYTLQIENWLLIFLITVIFAVHPLHVEVVANIKSRDEILQMLFGIWSVMWLKTWLSRKKAYLLLLSAVFLAASVLSKENGLTWVGVMGLVWFMHGTTSKFNLRTLLQGLAILVVGAGAIGLLAFGLSGEEGKELTKGMGIFYESPILGDCFRQTNDTLVLLVNKNLLLFRYIGKFLLPVNLTYYAGFNQIPMYNAASVISILGVIGTLGLLLLTVLAWLKVREVFLGFSIFFICLSPYLHLVRPMPDTMADRYMFSASLGLCIVLVLGSNWIFHRFIQNEKNRMAVLGLACVCMALVFSVLTINRNQVWKNNLTLFETDLPKLEHCAKAHEFYADALHVELEKTHKTQLVSQIVKHYERSIAISELSYYSFIKLGSNYAQWGNAQRGLKLLERCVQLFPEQADPHFYLGNALFQRGEFEQAKTHFQQARILSPNVHDSYYLESRCHLELGELQNAQRVARLGLESFPEQILFIDVLADVHLLEGDTALAIKEVDRIIAIQPTAVQFWKKSIGLRQLQGRMTEADSVYQSALRLGVDFR
jgi:tetratricopeptide (TPR) repeat protein